MAGHDRADVLSKIGAGGSPRPTQPVEVDGDVDDWKWVSRSSDDDDSDASPVVFDRETLLGEGGKRAAKRGGRALRNRRTLSGTQRPNEALRCKMFLLCLAFFSLGLCMAILGPTLPDIKAKTGASDLIALVFLVSIGALGRILITVITNNLYASLNPFHLILCAVGVAVPTTLLIPWCTSWSSVLAMCLAQGMCLGAIERGGIVVLHAFFPRGFRLLHLLYFCLALGAVISPLITTPFVFDSISESIAVQQDQRTVVRRARAVENGGSAEREILDERSAHALFGSGNETGVEEKNGTHVAHESSSQKPKKPDAAVGVDQSTDQKARENALKRAEEKAKQSKASTSSPITTTTTVIAQGNASTTKATSAVSTTSSTTTTRSPATTSTAIASTMGNVNRSGISAVMQAASVIATLDERNRKLPTSTSSANLIATTATEIEERLVFASEHFWMQIQNEVKKMNNVKLAYAIVSTLVLVSALIILLAFCCCCMPLSIDGEAKIKELHMQTALAPVGKRALMLVVGMSALLAAIESDLASLLTVFSLDRFAMQFVSSQVDGAVHTSLFWALVAMARFVFIARSDWGSSGRVMMFLLILSTLSAAFLTLFSIQSRALCLLGMASFAFFSGGLRPGIYCWLLAQTGLPGWRLSLLWLIAAGVGRFFGPLITAVLIQAHESSRFLIISLLSCCLLATVVFHYLQRSVNAIARQRTVNHLADRIGGLASEDEGELPRNKVSSRGNAMPLVDVADTAFDSDDDERRLFGEL